MPKIGYITCLFIKENFMNVSVTPLRYSTIGFDRFFDNFESILQNKLKHQSNFPPSNIIKINNNKYILEYAIAGFTKEDIEIVVQDNTLIIKGEKQKPTKEYEYIRHGISSRSFVEKLTLSDNTEVKSALFEHGILRIEVENVVPENKKPRKIEIKTQTETSQEKTLLLG